MDKPTIEEIANYLIEKKEYEKKGAQNFADKFWNYYESVGWVVGKARKKMQNWRAAINLWEQKIKEENAHKGHNTQKPGTSEARINTARNW